jgi:FAD/FMN-containing dehydrogenase
MPSSAEHDFSPLDASLLGQALSPGDEGWDQARLAWNLAVDQHPAAVVFAEGPEDVAGAVRYAAANGLRVAAQGTGHAAAMHQTLDDTILVKTARMTGVEIDVDGRVARVQAGVLCGDVGAAAGEHGLAPLLGSSPDVGVVGFTVGGGLGWLGREYGFACNSVRGAEVVTAGGEVVRADAENNQELFWAIRGGGGSFGIVTALDLDLYPMDTVFAGDVMFDVEHAPHVLRTYRDWARNAPAEVTSSVRFLTPPPLPDVPEPVRGRPLVTITASYRGDTAEGEDLLRPLREAAPAVVDMYAEAPAAALCRIHGDPEQPVPGITGGATIRELDDTAIDTLVQIAGAGSGSPLLQVDLRHLGGALGERAEGAGALGSLEGEFAVSAVGVPMGPVTPEAIHGSLKALAEAVEPWSTGVSYLNFTEKPSDASTAFSEEDYARLRAVKADLDPDRVIRGGQEIEPAR